MNNKFDVIIIGGGLGGLTAGATLAKRGKKVLLLEQHYIVGGCATTFKRKDFIMEVGLHEMDGLHEQDLKYAIFKDLGVFDNVELIQVPELFRYKSKTIDFVHPHGKEAAIHALIKQYPDEEKGIRTFLDLMDGVFSEIDKMPQKKWKQLLLFPIMPLIFPNIVKASRTNLGKFLDDHIKNEELKLILQGNLLYYHDDPYSMSMVYFSAAQSSYINGGGHFIKGGSQQLSNYLKSVIENNQGQVLMGKTATEILMKDSRVAGVVYQDSFNQGEAKTTVLADKVIANCAIPLLKSLLPEKESQKIANKTDHLEKACSLLTVYLGFKKPVKELNCHHYSTFVVGDDTQSLKDVPANYKGDWQNRSFVFVDYSQIDSGLAPEGKSFGVICSSDYIDDWADLDEESYRAKKQEVATVLIERLEKLIPGIKEQIDTYEVGTSKTVERYTLNPTGTAYGFAQTPTQSGNRRLPLKSDINGLYFAGAWSFPGGGFTGAIISGFLCANEVDEVIKRGVQEISTITDHRIVSLISSQEVATNTLELTYEKPENFEYEVGQYCILTLLNPKYTELDIPLRPLSIVSHPDDDFLKFTMRVSDSSYKRSIQAMQAGDRSQIFGPMGDFKVTTTDKDIVFLISGIGITPVIPLLRLLQESHFNHKVTLVYSNKTKESAAYHDYFESLEWQAFNYLPVFTASQPRVDVALLKSTVGSLDDKDFYIVGTAGFIRGMREILSSQQVRPESIIIDDFG